MFTLIPELPPFAVGIVAKDEVTAEDFKDVLEPAIEKALAQWKGINLLFVLETGLKNFTIGAWIQDVRINTRFFLKWNKLALVDHNPVLEKIAEAFDLIAPGEARTFSAAELEEAKRWISEP